LKDNEVTAAAETMPNRVSIAFLDVKGYRIRVAVRAGDPQRVPLLMFNGIGSGLELLVPLSDSLDGIESVMYDVPGTGESPTPWHPYNLQMLAELTE
jgi:pimeloyl-ACP methyl ester carboxylesterase